MLYSSASMVLSSGSSFTLLGTCPAVHHNTPTAQYAFGIASGFIAIQKIVDIEV